MKKLYEVRVNTMEQLGLKGERFLSSVEVLDTDKDLETQIKDIFLNAYDVTIVDVEYTEVVFNKYNLIIEEKKGYVVVLYNCKDGSKRKESKLYEEMPSDSFVEDMKQFFKANKAVVEPR